MSTEKINIEAILAKHCESTEFFTQILMKNSGRFTGEYDDTTHQLKAAIKEIVEQVIEKCAEVAELKFYPYNACPECGREDPSVDKSSILNVKQLIEY